MVFVIRGDEKRRSRCITRFVLQYCKRGCDDLSGCSGNSGLGGGLGAESEVEGLGANLRASKGGELELSLHIGTGAAHLLT